MNYTIFLAKNLVNQTIFAFVSNSSQSLLISAGLSSEMSFFAKIIAQVPFVICGKRGDNPAYTRRLILFLTAAVFMVFCGATAENLVSACPPNALNKKRAEWVTLPFCITSLNCLVVSLLDLASILLNSNFLSPFGASPGDSLAAAGTFHAHSKTVSFCALSFIWIIRE